MKDSRQIDCGKVELKPHKQNEHVMIASYEGESLFLIDKEASLKLAIYYYNQGLKKGFQDGKNAIQGELRQVLNVPDVNHRHSDYMGIQDEHF